MIRICVLFNGVLMFVYFSDGDSFCVHEGKYVGISVCFKGFNMFEIFGFVYCWGIWIVKEMYTNSKIVI